MLFMPLFGYGRVDEAVGIPAVAFSAKAAAGLAVSFLGGVVASVGALLASKEMLASASPTAASEPEPEAVQA
jgi:hypothetical protein